MSRASLVGDVREGVEVVGGEAAGGHAGADPEQALLALRVDAEHVPPLPDVIILDVNLESSETCKVSGCVGCWSLGRPAFGLTAMRYSNIHLTTCTQQAAGKA